MYSYAFLSTIATFLLISAVSASPTPTDLSPRACTTKVVDTIDYFDKANPTIPFPGYTIRLARTGGPGSNTIRTGLTFLNIPRSATGCTLHLSLRAPPSNQPDRYVKSTTPGQPGPNNFDVFGAASPVTYATTWNTQPRKTTLWGSVNVPYWPGASAVDQNILSTTCEETMSYVLELSDWQQNGGEVSFLHNGAKPVPLDATFSMVYNC
ncbi:MAG: hypothetical protein Q9227_004938 [Pyrenula ochraceoflavens]